MKLAIDFFGEPCQLVVMWLMTLPSEHCHTGGIFIVSKFKKKDGQIITLDNTRLGTFLFGPTLLMTLPFEHFHTGGVFMVAKVKKNGKT